MEEQLASVPAPSEAPPSSGAADQHFWNSAPSTAPQSLAPPIIEAPAPPRRARSNVAKVLFVVLFGAVVALLGYAVQQQLSRSDAGSPAWLSSAE